MKLKEIVSHPFFITLITIIFVTISWEFTVQLGYLNNLFFAAPTEIIRVLPYTLTELFIPNLLVTLLEYAVGFAIALGVGILLGVVIGSNDRIHKVLDPFIGLGMTTPKVVLVPFFIFGIGLEWNSIAAFGAIVGVFPILINSSAGIRQVKSNYITSAKAMGHSNFQIFLKVIFPFALPTILTGFFLGSNLVMIGVLVMELIMARVGIGPMMAELSYYFRTPELYAATLLTIIVTTSISGSIWYISRRMSAWREN